MNTQVVSRSGACALSDPPGSEHGAAAGDLVRASLRTLFTTLAVTAAGFFTSVITARLLGPEGRGLLSAALMIATLAAGVAQCGLATSLVYHRGAGRGFAYARLVAISLLAVCAVAAALAAGGLRFSADAGLQSHTWLIPGLAACLAAQTYFMTAAQLQPGLGFFNAMRFGIVGGNLAALLVLLAALGAVGYEDIVATQLVVAALLAAAGVLWVRGRLGSGARPAARWRDILSYGISHHGTVFLGLVLLNFDKIVLLKLGTMVQYGFYALAFTTSRLVGALQEAVSAALYARFAGKDPAQLSAGVKAAFRLTFLPMLVVATAAAAVSPWLIVLLFGQAFASMTPAFCILLFECVVGGASWILAQRFNAAGRPGMVFVRQLVSVLPVFAALPLLPRENLHVWLSLLMLAGASLRLAATMVLYPLVAGERVPGLLPHAADWRLLRAMLPGRRT
ncbi:MAG TPA: oligosaccharide flippase family protein [Burkholderiales bacterium]|nr:oligosaccharide flippase family protein [Burkholderiales bacterium]